MNAKGCIRFVLPAIFISLAVFLYAGCNDGAIDLEVYPQLGSMLATGKNHTAGVRYDGTVVAVGDNSYGQLRTDRWKDIVAVSVGSVHTVGLRRNGTVVAVGDNSWGQCRVSRWRNIVAISAGDLHTVGLKDDGTVVATGTLTRFFYESSSSRKRGDASKSGYVEDWSDIVAISAGYAHTVGVRRDGTVIAIGNNQGSQCDVAGWTDIVGVATGIHTVGVKRDGTVVTAGSDPLERGFLDVHDWDEIVAVAAGHDTTYALKSDGTLVAEGIAQHIKGEIAGWSGIVAISAYHYHIVGLRKDGTVVAAGDNRSGQLDVESWTGIKICSQ